MKVNVGSCMLVCLVGVVFLLSFILVSGEASEILVDGDTTMGATTSRSLKENGDGNSNDQGHDGTVSLEDYRPYDPSPSSKASIRPGPIQHGTPIMPYIPSPKPSPPPSNSDYDGSDP